MIEGLEGRVVAYESNRPSMVYEIGGLRPVEYMFGPWTSKVTLEFEGELPEWLRKACQENMGRVRILP